MIFCPDERASEISDECTAGTWKTWQDFKTKAVVIVKVPAILGSWQRSFTFWNICVRTKQDLPVSNFYMEPLANIQIWFWSEHIRNDRWKGD